MTGRSLLDIEVVENLWGIDDPTPGDMWSARSATGVWIYGDTSRIGEDTARNIQLTTEDFITVLSPITLVRDDFTMIRVMTSNEVYGHVIGWIKVYRAGDLDEPDKRGILTILKARRHWNTLFRRIARASDQPRV